MKVRYSFNIRTNSLFLKKLKLRKFHLNDMIMGKLHEDKQLWPYLKMISKIRMRNLEMSTLRRNWFFICKQTDDNTKRVVRRTNYKHIETWRLCKCMSTQTLHTCKKPHKAELPILSTTWEEPLAHMASPCLHLHYSAVCKVA